MRSKHKCFYQGVLSSTLYPLNHNIILYSDVDAYHHGNHDAKRMASRLTETKRNWMESVLAYERNRAFTIFVTSKYFTVTCRSLGRL